MTRRQHSASIVKIIAECQRCNFRAETKNAQALAAQHHDKHGHRVEVSITTKIVYGSNLGLTRKDAKQGGLNL